MHYLLGLLASAVVVADSTVDTATSSYTPSANDFAECVAEEDIADRITASWWIDGLAARRFYRALVQLDTAHFTATVPMLMPAYCSALCRQDAADDADHFFRSWLAPRVDAAAAAAAAGSPLADSLRRACPYSIAFVFDDDGDAFVLDMGGLQGPSLEYVAWWHEMDHARECHGEGCNNDRADLVIGTCCDRSLSPFTPPSHCDRTFVAVLSQACTAASRGTGC